MKTIATEKQLITFGNYLLGCTRRNIFKNNPNFPKQELLKERLAKVTDADLAHFFTKINKNPKLKPLLKTNETKNTNPDL